MQDNITTPLSPEDRQELIRRLSTPPLHLISKFQEMAQYISEDTSAHMRDVWEMTETCCLLMLLSAFLLRGATPSTISRYITTDEGELPFRGCEQELLDSLLTSMREVAGDPDFLDRASIEFAALIDEMIRLVATETGVARPALCEFIFRSRASE